MANFDQRRRPVARPRYANIDGVIRVPRQKPTYHAQTVHPGLRRQPVDAEAPKSKIAPSLPRMDSIHTHNKKPHTKIRKKKLVVRIVVGIVATLLLAGGWLAWRGLGAVDKVLHGNVLSDAHALLTTTKLKGEDQGRVNVLLAGDSADDTGHQGADLTDSIMILSIDTKNHTGLMLSIPRDLWVSIPGWSHQKINSANIMTSFNKNGYPKGGMGQLEEIIQSDLGIPIDYYALINYTAFKDSVNAVGGIPIDIQSDDSRGLYDPNISRADNGPLLLKNGKQTLNGQTALNLARARGDPTYDGRVAYGFSNGDFTRTQHQRQMLAALEQKASSAGVLANPLKISKLFSAVGNNINTDLTVGDVLRASQLTKGINMNKLQSLTLGASGPNALLSDYVTPAGQDALIPKAGLDDFSQIQHYYQQLTSNNPVVKEGSSAVILNGSNAAGLAHKEQTTLQGQGFGVASIADTNGTYSTTTILDTTNGQKPASKQELQKLFPKANLVTSTNISAEAQEAAGYNADFVVILGQDQAPAQASVTTQATTGGD